MREPSYSKHVDLELSFTVSYRYVPYLSRISQVPGTKYLGAGEAIRAKPELVSHIMMHD